MRKGLSKILGSIINHGVPVRFEVQTWMGPTQRALNQAYIYIFVSREVNNPVDATPQGQPNR